MNTILFWGTYHDFDSKRVIGDAWNTCTRSTTFLTCMVRWCNLVAWWRLQTETFSALLNFCAGNSPVTGELPSQRPVTRSFHVFFDLHPSKRLTKQSWDWLFETLFELSQCYIVITVKSLTFHTRYHISQTISSDQVKYISQEHGVMINGEKPNLRYLVRLYGKWPLSFMWKHSWPDIPGRNHS